MPDMSEDSESDDFLQSLGVSALGSRLRRLFESLNVPVSQLYRDELDFEQRWFSLTLLLKHRGRLSVKEASEALGVSHVAVLQVSKSMLAKELIEKQRCESDSRVMHLRLSSKGAKLAARIEVISAQVDRAARQLLSEAAPDFVRSLTKLEDSLKNCSFEKRLAQASTTSKKE